MATYVFTRTEGRTPRNGSGTPYTVRIFRVKPGARAALVATSTDSFMSEWQQVMHCAERAKLWPRKVFERGTWGGYAHGTPDVLREKFRISVSHIW